MNNELPGKENDCFENAKCLSGCNETKYSISINTVAIDTAQLCGRARFPHKDQFSIRDYLQRFETWDNSFKPVFAR